MNAALAEAATVRQLRRSVEETLRSLARAFRAMQMYAENNPVRPKSVEDAKQAFRELWRTTDDITLAITETSFLLDDHVVFNDDDRGGGGLPWLLYRDGLRQLNLSAGIEDRELESLLNVLQRSRAAQADEDDLVTMLWVANFTFLGFRNIELLADFDVFDTESLEADPIERSGFAVPASQLHEADLPGDGPAPSTVNTADFESSLNALEPAEIEYLRRELRLEYEDDGFPRVMESLFDILENADSPDFQSEVCDAIEQLADEALADNRFVVVTRALREARVTRARSPHMNPAVLAALEHLPLRFSQPDATARFLDVLSASDGSALAPIVEPFISELHSRAFPAMLSWYAQASASTPRLAMEQALIKIGLRHPTEIARLIEHLDVAVAHGAVLLVPFAPSPAFVAPLAKALDAGHSTFRADVVKALSAVGSPGALQQLERVLDDSARDIRIAALKAFTKHHHRAVLARLQRDMHGKALRSADLSEQMAFFEAFGALGGDSSVSSLDAILNAKTFFRYKESVEMRACAAHALGTTKSALARKALERSANAAEPMVRSAVSRAILEMRL